MGNPGVAPRLSGELARSGTADAVADARGIPGQDRRNEGSSDSGKRTRVVRFPGDRAAQVRLFRALTRSDWFRWSRIGLSLKKDR